MGGSGGGGFRSSGGSSLSSRINQAVRESDQAATETEIAEAFAERLKELNQRDVAEINRRADEINDALLEELEDHLTLNFGGSVAKNTYVDGLSDVDMIAIMRDTPDHHPRDLLDRLTALISEKLGKDATVSHGNVAVTVKYKDGLELQIVPAVHSGEKLAVPSWEGDAWSSINSRGFAEALTRRNQECSGRLVPVIKLAKAMNGSLPESQRLTGYHIESLAIAAFRGYDGQLTTKDMLRHFFSRTPDLLLQPIKDRTGQSVHVDAYLGDPHSSERETRSHVFSGLGRRLENALSTGSLSKLNSLFE